MSLLISTHGLVRVIELNRPEVLNALDPDSIQQLREAIADARDNDSVAAIVLTGSGEKSFSTGADLKNTAPPDVSYAGGRWEEDSIAASKGIYGRLLDFRSLKCYKPMIAAVNGFCVGGGMELALQCDICIASDNASFGFPEAKIGSIPGVNGIPLLLRAISRSDANYLLMSGERIKAERAYQIGLISEVMPLDQLRERALAIATAIAGNAPLAVRCIKEIASRAGTWSDDALIDYTELAWGVLRDTEDRLEGRAAFAEKRPPEYKGR